MTPGPEASYSFSARIVMESENKPRIETGLYLSLSDVSWFGLPPGCYMRLRDEHPEDNSDLDGLPEIAVY